MSVIIIWVLCGLINCVWWIIESMIDCETYASFKRRVNSAPEDIIILFVTGTLGLIVSILLFSKDYIACNLGEKIFNSKFISKAKEKRNKK